MLRHAEVGGLHLNEYLQTRPTPWHRHEDFNLALILEGSGRSATAKGEFSYAQGQVVFESRDLPQRHDCASLRCLNIHFPPSLIEDYGKAPPSLMAVQCFGGGSHVALMRRIYAELRLGDSASRIALHGLSLELIAELVRPRFLSAQRSPPPWVRRVEERLRASFRETPSLLLIAAEAGLHPAHLSRAFHKFTGCTLGDYVRGLRVELALELLADAELPLPAIAVQAGFYDQADMTRSVKRLTGRTPGEHRSQASP